MTSRGMRELLISEITRMAAGLCVIGLERHKEGYSSFRPIPHGLTAWPQFPYYRADRISFDLSLSPGVTEHHCEDRRAGNPRLVDSVSEGELVGCLRQAEVANSVKDLFGCDVHPSPRGGPAVYVNPVDAKRSVCGCKINSVRFRFYPEKIRVALALESGETLDSLPVVDRDLHAFAKRFDDESQGRLESFFNSFIVDQIMSSPIRFARIGLARPDRDGLCWLMLDSLFPLPTDEWAEEFK
jgi:hypothetical protein